VQLQPEDSILELQVIHTEGEQPLWMELEKGGTTACDQKAVMMHMCIHQCNKGCGNIQNNGQQCSVKDPQPGKHFQCFKYISPKQNRRLKERQQQIFEPVAEQHVPPLIAKDHEGR